MKLGTRLILIFCLLILIPMILVGVVSFQRFSNELQTITIRHMEELQESLISEINSIRLRNEEFSDKILSQGTIQAVLNKRNSDQELWVELEEKARVEQILAGMSEPLRASNILIIANDGRTFRSNSDTTSAHIEKIIQSTLYRTALQSNGSNIWLPLNEDVFSQRLGAPHLYIVRKMNSLSMTSQGIGYCIIQFRYEELENVFERMDFQNSEFFKVIGEDGTIFYDNQKNETVGTRINPQLWERIQGNKQITFQLDQNGETFLVSYKPNLGTGWSIVHGVPNSAIYAKSVEVRQFTFMVMFICLVIAIFAAVYVSRNIVRPIRQLKNSMLRFGDGNLHVKVEMDRHDEIGMLQRSFNVMVNDIQKLLHKIDEEHKTQQMLELKMLEYQINPHFLYNTLDRINWMAHKQAQTETGEMITALARYFRLGLSKGRDIYRVKDEIDHVSYYTFIINNRGLQKFSFDVDVDPTVMENKTLKIILQPLVENAVKHGCSEEKQEFVIKVRAFLDGKDLIYEVEDNGKGIASSELVHIRNQYMYGQSAGEENKSMGLRNVDQRVKLTFGNQYGLELDSALGRGTVVRVRLPGMH